ncbi:MAG: endonuclease Q family protein [Candidatus Bathyarchaeia archaeon]
MRKSHLVYADLHIHGRYSRATSENMDIHSIIRFAKLKGLNLVGTGDFTHPMWKRELQNHLQDSVGTGLYTCREDESVLFIVTAEVCTVFNVLGKAKKIHHLLICPSLEVADQVSDTLTKYGSLEVDGRPTLQVSAAELVEAVRQLSPDIMVIPAHVWTPWFSLFGSVNGFDAIEDCYEDQTSHIVAIETGLSSDPPMNWRLSALDRFTLVSNSDAHSPYPYRIGREANVFRLDKVTFKEVTEVISLRDSKRFLFTVETDPAYGKYHWSGHRSCNFSVPALESIKLNGICSICRKEMTKGVEERVERLADRPRGFRPPTAIGFVHLLPLQEIIAAVRNIDPSSSTVWREYMSLIQIFGDEYSVLLASEDELRRAAEPRLAEAIVRIRNDEVVVKPGYDGVYGRIDLATDKKTLADKPLGQVEVQRKLLDFNLGWKT